MSAVAKLAPVQRADVTDPLAKLREPFPPHQISKLPKQSKNQGEEVKADRTKGVNCQICGGWHHKNAVHLDYVGHAALTDRLLDVDPHWSWEPVAFGQDGLPASDRNGGLWIRLTVCGVTRLGYGNADGKSGGDAVKEIIGDALRNAAMRFGAALDLWHKGDLHVSDEVEDEPKPAHSKDDLAVTAACSAMIMCADLDALKAWGKANAAMINGLPDAQSAHVAMVYKERVAALKEPPKSAPPTPENDDPFSMDGDRIPF